MQNYFELFGLPPAFRIDNKDLVLKHRELQGLLHPDRYINSSTQERRLAAEKSALVNTGYSILSDNCKRAQHLLQVEGVDFDEQKDKMNDGVFLVELMELEESIQEACNQSDIKQAVHFLETIKDKMDTMSKSFEKSWLSKNWENAHQYVLKMKFLANIHQRNSTLIKRLENL